MSVEIRDVSAVDGQSVASNGSRRPLADAAGHRIHAAVPLADASGHRIWRALCCALLAVVSLACQRNPIGGLPVGQSAPLLEAKGWINGPPPSLADRQGKLTVVIAWAWWCAPCRAEAPKLVRLYEQYHDKGVEFVGLTAEGDETLDRSEKFVEAAGIKWPNGYGALETLQKLDVQGFPSIWLIDGDNKVLWNFDSERELETAIETALKSPADAHLPR